MDVVRDECGEGVRGGYGEGVRGGYGDSGPKLKRDTCYDQFCIL